MATERRLRAASMMSKQLRDQKKKISKVFQYFTGDEFEEFEKDLTADDLIPISDEEKAGEKGEDDDETSHTNSKKVKSHRVMSQILDKMDRLDQVFTQMSLNLNSNISSTQL